MQKFWLVFRQEYRSRVFTWRFFVTTFGMPLLGSVMVGFMFAVMTLNFNPSPLGYVDEAGLLVGQVDRSSLPVISSEMIAFAGEAQARAALEHGQIKAYYVLPAGFREDRHARLVYRKAPSAVDQSAFASRVRRALLAGLPADRAKRISSLPLVIGLSILPQKANEPPSEGPPASPVAIRLLLPYLTVLFLIVSLNTSIGHLSSGMAEEKLNRTVEILVTSVSPTALLLGKTFALITVGLTQLLLLNGLPGLVLGVALLFGASVANLLPFGAGVLIGLLILTLFTFLLISALIIILSSIASEQTDIKQFAPFISLTLVAPPFLLVEFFAAQPNGPVALALSFFPFTAVVGLLMRTAFGNVPAWQFLVSGLILLLSAVGLLWFSGRIFHLSMLRYNKPLTIRELLHLMRPPRK